MPDPSRFEQFLSHHEIPRRDVLKVGGAAVVSASLNRLPWALREGSQLYDLVASPESILPGPLPVLEPRLDDRPVVTPHPCGEAVQVQTACAVQGTNAAFNLQSKGVRGEHVGTPLRDETFTLSGAAVITTAEGPVKGKQEYCMLLKGESQVMAVGYEGGMYLFAPELAHGDPNKGGTSGEWVRLLAQPDSSAALPSPAISSTSWGKLQTGAGQLLVQQVVAGTQKLQEIGYRPWAATLPSTRMPDMQRKELTPANCAQTVAEACNKDLGKSYFVSNKGDIIDITHMRAKAAETLDAFTQMYYQYATGEQQPTVSIRYGRGSDAEFVFSIDPDSVKPETLLDTTFALMQTESMLMEGIAQRYVVENVPFPLGALLPESGGLGPEDLFSNSLAITGILSLLKEYDMATELGKALEAVQRDHPNASAETLQAATQKTMKNAEDILVQYVINMTAHSLGVREQAVPISVELPRCLYALVPTKMTVDDAATPTHVNIRAAGIEPNNPQARFTNDHVPAMQTFMERALNDLGI